MSEVVEKKPLVVLPYTTRIDQHGRIRLSSNSNLVTDAAFYLYKEGNVSEIFIPGENTFGPDYKSTADLMKKSLVERGVPEGRIHPQGNLNDTEVQLAWAKDQITTGANVLVLGFHKRRAELLVDDFGMNANILKAEPTLLKYHASLTPEKLRNIINTKSTIAGISKVQIAEFILRTGTRLGRPGKIAVHLIRTAMKAEGATVTDYRFVGSADKYLQEVLQSGITPH